MAIADIFAGLLVTVLGFGLGTPHKSHGSLLTCWEGKVGKAPNLTDMLSRVVLCLVKYIFHSQVLTGFLHAYVAFFEQ